MQLPHTTHIFARLPRVRSKQLTLREGFCGTPGYCCPRSAAGCWARSGGRLQQTAGAAAACWQQWSAVRCTTSCCHPHCLQAAITHTYLLHPVQFSSVPDRSHRQPARRKLYLMQHPPGQSTAPVVAATHCLTKLLCVLKLDGGGQLPALKIAAHRQARHFRRRAHLEPK